MPHHGSLMAKNGPLWSITRRSTWLARNSRYKSAIRRSWGTNLEMFTSLQKSAPFLFVKTNLGGLASDFCWSTRKQKSITASENRAAHGYIHHHQLFVIL